MTVQELRSEIERRPPDAATQRRFERARRDVVYEEVAASCAIAGVQLPSAAIRRLVERGLAPAGPIGDHLLVLGYAHAALGIARERPVTAPVRRLITVPEIERLHMTIVAPLAATRGAVRPEAWRRTNLPPVREGMVTVPHWLIEFEMSALVDRIGGGPASATDDALFAWLADTYERLERIQPFVEGNGRVARLVVNLMLARVGYPPVTISAQLLDAYRRALRAADAGDRAPLASIFERALRANLARLVAATFDARHLAPLAAFARKGLSLDALRKAAQRGRLHTVAHGRQLVTTQEWVERYLDEKSRAGRPPRRGR